MIGMTAQSVVAAVIPLVLSFGGGTAIAFFSKENAEIRKDAERAIFALSIGALIGLFGGIFIAENQLLTCRSSRNENRDSVSDRKYLRSIKSDEIVALDEQVRNSRLSKEEAFDKIVELANKP